VTIDATPYDELDPPVLALCQVINGLPGLETREHPAHEEGIGDPWQVSFWCDVEADHRPSADAWLSLEFVAWCVYDVGQSHPVQLFASSPPPYLNEPAHSLRFIIEGNNGPGDPIESAGVAGWIEEWATELYFLPPGSA
jgi:hypothetical protein